MAANITDEQPYPASVLPRAKTRGIVDLLLTIGVVALMGLSSYALDFLGYSYSTLGGSILTKIHPATYLFSLALCIAVIANRNPVVYLTSLLLRCLGSTFLLISCLLLWYFISRYKPDYAASFLIDSIMAAGLIFMLFRDADDRTRLMIARLVHIIMVLNCFIAIVEGQTGWRLFPFINDGRQQTWEYRATALLGHPLIGSLVTGVYAVILMTVRDLRGLNERWRLPIVLLCMATMPSLGSRTSFTVVYATAAAVAGLGALRFLRGGTSSVRTLVWLMVAVPFGIVVIAAMFQFGLFDNFLDRFSNDSGSAQSRVKLFSLFKDFGLADFFMGESSLRLDTNVRLSGLEEGIESSWPGHVLRYGVVMSVVLWFGIAGWFVDMLRTAGKGGILPLAFVFLVISTSVGISGKTTMISIPSILILALVIKKNGAGSQAVRSERSNALDCIERRIRVAGPGAIQAPDPY
ncbi:VpsF family polysaccharide biosynthesis protein [Mesorhizobium sp. ES1-1]|uniref:VpsF family polysaccharide biosynthesis protein n=1 Tax=Mesorhizobium sp. ES1-1 TaxID=2876629 RepID=UPI001CCFC123|nr:VpsF family polysaccharide biosynthesis protein [Mesorhizobium sp. ES1-1]MBZ9674367.1 VpsF family polysaccharide biosynthesis protein [Mesorhizobium sp. ES1-1]